MGNRNKSGFTLVELLVVISIMALLMSILMPSLSKARKQAQAVVCQANLKQWSSVFLVYANSNDDCLPGTSWITQSVWWIAPVRPYYFAQEKLLLCPSAKKATPNSAEGGPSSGWTVLPPYSQLPEGDHGSYGINGWVANVESPDLIPFAAKGMYDYHWKRTSVSKANTIPLFLDCGTIDGWPWPQDKPPTKNGDISSPSGDNMRRFCIDRHQGYINSSFLDFSVRKVGLKELWRLKWSKGFDTSAGIWDRMGWPTWMQKYK